MNKEARIEKELEGLDLVKEVYGDDFMHDRILQWEDRVDEDLNRAFVNFVWKGLYSRKILDPKVRELCAISALAVLHDWPVLRTHVKVALRNGATEAEVKEAIVQMAVYGGMPTVVQAWPHYEQAVEEFRKTNSVYR